ncbi:MAG: GspH/FimT family pseudopilin [Burkholderiales bacterium]
MPTSARGTSSGRGFTLIELLVVLLIMGISASLIGAIVRPDDRARLRVEAERLAQLLELAADESRLTGKRIAWTADGAQYRFWRWRDEVGWSEAIDDSLHARTLPSGMAISDLRIEAKPAPGGMRLEFGPYGALAYDLRLSLGDARYAVAASPVGEVRIDEPR